LAEAGYQIRNKFYPFPSSFRLLDSVLIRELTGMSWEEFINGMPDDDDPDAVADPTVMSGLIGVAVWQANPTWPRAKVSRFVQGITMEEVEAVGMEEDEEEEADASPPVEEETPKTGETSSEKSAAESESDSDSTSQSLNQKPSGNQLSVITPAS
jgi:hypothetical protein